MSIKIKRCNVKKKKKNLLLGGRHRRRIGHFLIQAARSLVAMVMVDSRVSFFNSFSISAGFRS